MGDHRRFLITPQQISGDVAVLSGAAARQISRVLRLCSGDRIRLLDGCGNECEAQITTISRDEVTTRILNTRVCPGEPALRLSLAVCLPKSDKLELIVQKCAELGISEVIVVNSQRSVTRLEAQKIPQRLERWRRIAAEAAEQCGRGRAPEITGVEELGDLAGAIERHSLALIAWEDESRASLKSVLGECAKPDSVLLIVGPEGGFTPEEVLRATAAGAKCVTLGSRILRCETAAIGACAAIMYEIEGEL